MSSSDVTDPSDPPEAPNVVRNAEDGFPIFPDVGQGMALIRQLRSIDAETRSLLSAQGLHIVDAKDKAVLEACSAIVLIPNLFTTGYGMSLHDAERIMAAELARREKA
jgi:hypothetical protein